MKAFQLIALFACFVAACAAEAADKENNELKLAKGEMAEMSHRMARRLREDGPGKKYTKNLRQMKEGEHRLDEERSAKHAAKAEQVRKVADGLKKQRFADMKNDPRMKHKIESAKLSHHSKASRTDDGTRAVKEEALRKVAGQIPQKLGKKETPLKTLPDVKKATDNVKQSVPKKAIPGVKKAMDKVKESAPRKVAPGAMKSAQEKIGEFSKDRNVEDVEGSDGNE